MAKNGGHDGYVELPYTLVQDSTLLLFLREKTIAIWKKKLDWVAENPGQMDSYVAQVQQLLARTLTSA